jgi:hypothetical protein
MYCTVIHCVAYKEDFFITNCQAAYLSVQITEKRYYILWSFYDEINVRFMINWANDILR